MRHLVAVLAAVPLLLLPAASATAPTASAAAPVAPVRLGTPAAPAVEVDFTGTVSLRGCSGSVVRPPAYQPSDPALVLTNGHCVRILGADEVVVDEEADRTFTLVRKDGDGTMGTLRSSRLVYATMSKTDVALYRLNLTYADVEAMGTRALELAPAQPAAGSEIRVVSGYWKRMYSCHADAYVHELREAEWSWRGSMRYTAPCDTKGGTSGSPVVDVATGKVVAVNNTGNVDGERCTRNNPCEVDENGMVTVHQGIGYAQQTHVMVPCLTGGGRVDLTAPGCGLPRPAGA